MDRSHRWQFSLTTLLILTAVVAVTSAAVSAPPSWVSGLALGFLSFAFPTAFVLVIVYGEGYWRTFCIGALVPSLEGWAMSAFAVLFVAVESFTTSASTVTTAPPPTTMMTPSYNVPTSAGVVPDGGVFPDAVPSSPASPDGVAAASDEDDDAGAITANVGVTLNAPVTTTWTTTTTPTTYGVDFSAIRPLSASFAQLFRVGGAIYWTFAVALGFFAVGIRWLIECTKARRVAALNASS